MLKFAAFGATVAQRAFATSRATLQVIFFRQISLALFTGKLHHRGVRTNGMGKETDFIRSGTHPA